MSTATHLAASTTETTPVAARPLTRSPRVANIVVQPTASSIAVEILRGDRAIIAPLAVEWDQLCAEGPCHLPFFTPAWITAWLDSFAPEARLLLLTARRDGKLRGVLPFIEHRTGPAGLAFTRLVAPANVHSHQLDIVCGAEDRDTVVAQIWQTLITRVRWDVVEYRDVPEDGGFAKLMQIAARAGYPAIVRETLDSPVISLSAETDLAKIGPSKNIRRARRLVDKAGDYQYLRHDVVDQALVDRFIALEAAGWKGENGTALRDHPDEAQFYARVMTQRGPGFHPVMQEIRLGEATIAMHLGIEMGERYVEPKGAYDQEHRNLGPSHLLFHETVTQLLARGFTSFGLLGQMEPYKALWTSETQRHQHALLFRQSPKGRALRWAVERLIPVVKQWRTRQAGGTEAS